MENKPVFKEKTTWTIVIIELLGVGIIIISWYILAIYLKALPIQIPIHFNASGVPNNWGSKNSLLVLPILSTSLYILISFLNKYPQSANYIGDITPQNMDEQYRTSKMTLRLLKLSVAVIFLILEMGMIKKAGGHIYVFGSWVLPCLLITITLPSIYFIF